MTMSQQAEQDSKVLQYLCSWNMGGQAQLRALIEQELSHALTTSDYYVVGALLLSILRQCLFVREAQDAELGKLLVQVVNSTSNDPSDLFADSLIDTIWTVYDELMERLKASTDQEDLLDVTAQNSQRAQKVTDEIAESRLLDLVNHLLADKILSEHSTALRLRLELLAKVRLCTDDIDWLTRRQNQIRTARFYTQTKFNLLREDNEGYTALITEVLSNLGPCILPSRLNGPDDHQSSAGNRELLLTVLEQESSVRRNERARSVMSNVQALIGQFNLDANRALDIILDLFTSNLIRHYPFFLALFSASPWRTDVNAERTTPTIASRYASLDLDLSHDTGNTICAKLLGFKLSQSRRSNDDQAVTTNLYLATAMLIKTGFVRLSDIYADLGPDEEGMIRLHAKHRQAQSAKSSSARSNALSMAAPLADEAGRGSLSTDSQKTTTDEAKEPPNQILWLLHALLDLGDLRHSLFILTRYSWLCAAYSEVADKYLRLLTILVAPASDAMSIPHTKPAAAPPSVTVPISRWNASSKAALLPMPRPLMITSSVPEPLCSAYTQPVYFYADWHVGLPRCQTSQDLENVFLPLLRILGAGLCRDTAFLHRVCRLTNAELQRAVSAQDEDHRQTWLNVLRQHLLPALSLSSSNNGLLSEFWDIVKMLPYEERFALYGQWKYDLYRRADMRSAQAATEKGAKDILKRISKDNIRQSSRNLAKASHSNPTIFFTVALTQVQAYDNLIQPLVECAQYLTPFEHDIFGFILIDALSNPEKERTKKDGTNTSLWLKSLASFSGTLFRRYPAIDFVPVLQYLVNQLKANNSKDLIIVSELITKMSGIEPLANLSDSQVAALTGGRNLHMEAMMAANALTGSKERSFVQRSGQRLLDALVESKLAVPLLLLIAQQRQACIYLVPDSDAHLKYLGNLYDTCQEVLLQYVEFLYNHLQPADYAATVPGLRDLGLRFGLDPAIAFYIARPKLVHSMKQFEAAEAAERLRVELKAGRDKPTATAGDAVHADAVMESAEAKDREPLAEPQDVEMVASEDTATPADVPKDTSDDLLEQDATSQASDQHTAALASPWHPGLDEATAAVSLMLPEAVQLSLGVHFYVTFWQLSLSDIHVPFDRYQQETKRLKALVTEMSAEEQRRRVQDNSKATLQKKRLQDTVAQLDAEMKEQTKAHEVTRKRLKTEKDHWFSDTVDRSDVVVHFVQHCLFPRALLSPTDAIFAGKFLRRMHDVGTPNFWSMETYNMLLGGRMETVIFSSTENEARSYSRFLYTILTDLSAWHRSSEAYSKEAIGERLPGFQRTRRSDEGASVANLLTWEEYRDTFCDWHASLHKAFIACLQSTEYMRIRNAIAIMTRLAPFYPLIDTHGSEIVAVIANLVSVEQRGDIKILAQGLLATLKARKKSWMPEDMARNDPAVARARLAQADPTQHKSEASDDGVEFLSIKHKDTPNSIKPKDTSNSPEVPVKSVEGQSSVPTTLRNVDSSEANVHNGSTRLPAGVNLPNRPAIVPRTSRPSDVHKPLPASAGPSLGTEPREHAREQKRVAPVSESTFGKVGDIVDKAKATDVINRSASTKTDAGSSQSDKRDAGQEQSSANGSVPSNVPESRTSTLPATYAQTSDAVARMGSGGSDADIPPAKLDARRTQDVVSDSPRQTGADRPTASRYRHNTHDERRVSGTSTPSDTRVSKNAGPYQIAGQSGRSLATPDADSDRPTASAQNIQVRGAADRHQDLAPSRTHDQQPSSFRERIDERRSDDRHHEDRRKASGSDRDRRKDSNRYGDRPALDRNERRRSRGLSSRDHTPAPDAAGFDRGSGRNTPLRTHTEPDRGREAPRSNRPDEGASSRSTPMAMDEARKRSLGVSSGRSHTIDEDPSKRPRIDHEPQRSTPLHNSTRPDYDSRQSNASTPSSDVRHLPPNARSSALPDAHRLASDSRPNSGTAPYQGVSSSSQARSAPHPSRPSDNGSVGPSHIYSSRPSGYEDAKPSSIYSSKPPAHDRVAPSHIYSSRPSDDSSARPSPIYSSRPSDDSSARPSPIYSSRPSDDSSARPSTIYSSRPHESDRQSSYASGEPLYNHGRQGSRDSRGGPFGGSNSRDSTRDRDTTYQRDHRDGSSHHTRVEGRDRHAEGASTYRPAEGASTYRPANGASAYGSAGPRGYSNSHRGPRDRNARRMGDAT